MTDISPITGRQIRAKRIPTTVEARPECWAIDGNYLGAEPLSWWDGSGPVSALVNSFSEEQRFVIAVAVLHEWPPPAWIELAYGMAEIPSRAWWEWHWYRTIDPFTQRKPIPKSLRDYVIERDEYVCGLCGGEVEPDDVHLDHIVPVTHGGQNEAGNLQVAHSICNLRKGNRV